MKMHEPHRIAFMLLIGFSLAGCSSFSPGYFNEGAEHYNNTSIFAPVPANYRYYGPGYYGTSTNPYYSGTYGIGSSPRPIPYNVTHEDEVKYSDLNNKINQRVQGVSSYTINSDQEASIPNTQINTNDVSTITTAPVPGIVPTPATTTINTDGSTFLPQ